MSPEVKKRKEGEERAVRMAEGGALVSAAASTADQKQTAYTDEASGVTILTQNVVVTVNMQTTLKLMEIAMQARNTEYNPDRFAACIMRIANPKSTALIFASGKVVITGTKTIDCSREAARKFGAILRRLGQEITKPDKPIVQNIVCSCDCRFAIRLEALALAHGKFSSFEPELFPGLVYRMANPKVVLLIFVSGKVVITGAKDPNHTYEAFSKIYPVLLEFKKVDT